MNLFNEFRNLIWLYRNRLEFQAEQNCRDFQNFLSNVKSYYDINYRNLRILEIGCGQRYPHALILAQDNEVHAIDLNVIIYSWAPLRITRMFTKDGIIRGTKTVVRKALFDKKYHEKLAECAGKRLTKMPEFHTMNAEDLDFLDSTFDFVFSVAVFEHIRNVETAVTELRRVLKPSGIFAIEINPFTGITGGHNLYGKDETTTEVPPWDHIRQNLYPATTYLNKLRLGDYRDIFSSYFDDVHFIENESNQYKKYLTNEIREELSDYSEHELLTLGMGIIGKK
ncbi:MAG: methyltransferase domain-containing protein [candidate division Zixibacteria bacterium]|nr:methyltransferase domain-containing protein [candidate division Zixibacteria bacterium]